jgi:hypothetical protein
MLGAKGLGAMDVSFDSTSDLELLKPKRGLDECATPSP